MRNYLICPVRGKFTAKEVDNFQEFTEEYRRIECV